MASLVILATMFVYIMLTKTNNRQINREENKIENATDIDELFKDYVAITLDGNFPVKLDVPNGKILKTETRPNFDSTYKTGSLLFPKGTMFFRGVENQSENDYILLYNKNDKPLDEKSLYIKKTIKEPGCDAPASECPIQTYTDSGYYCTHPHSPQSRAGYFSCSKTDIIEKANQSSPETAWILWDEDKSALYGYSFVNFSAFPFGIYTDDHTQLSHSLNFVDKKLISYNYQLEKLNVIEPSKDLIQNKKEFSTPELSTNKHYVVFVNFNRVIIYPFSEPNKCIIDVPTNDDITHEKKLWTTGDQHLIIKSKGAIYIINTNDCTVAVHKSTKIITSVNLSKSNKYFVYITEDSFSRDNQYTKHREIYSGEIEAPEKPGKKIFEIYNSPMDFSGKENRD